MPSMTRLAATLVAPVVLLAALLAGGCTTYHKQAPVQRVASTAYEATHYQAQIKAPDGTRIRFTVWQPRLGQGERAPLVIHAHGFALTRMDSSLDLYAKLLLAGQAAYRAWERGYWVISIDQRGHGASGGTVGMHEWDKEVADISYVIDWAQRNLAIAEVNEDPLVGMIGESYGGAIQYLASVNDPRIDAIVPLTTWYDLERSLVPNGVVASDWALFLGAAGYFFNPFHMDNGLTMSMAKEVLFADVQPQMRARMHRNSLAFHCEGGNYPHADALIIQGFRDVLFSVDQGIDARDCFQRAGRDVRLVAVEHGHLAPTAQLPPIRIGSMPVWHVDPYVRCEGRSYNVRDIIIHWFDMKLRGANVSDSAVPRWCLTGDRSVDALKAEPPATTATLPHVHVGSGAAGLVEWIARPMESAKNWFVPRRVPEDWATPRNGWLRPARVPLMRIEKPTWIVGSPVVEANIDEADRANPILFLRMAAWKPGSGNYRVLSQQVTPVRGKGPQTIRLHAVRAKLQPDEILGLLVNGYSNQFRMTGSGWGTDAGISGSITLPLAAAEQ